MEKPGFDMVPSDRSKRGPTRGRILVGFVALLMVSTAGYGMNWPPPEPVQLRVDRTVEIIDRLKSLVPEPITKMDDRAFELGFDVDAAIEYVRAEIAYEPYSGVLRGPDGAAAVRRGNAWDQALLLASLIKSIGGDAQIVSGSLSPADAERLLAEAFENTTAPPPFEPDHHAISEALGELDPALATGYRRQVAELSGEGSERELAEATDSVASSLLALLGERDPGFEPRSDADPLKRRVAEDYVWVRWRMGPGDDWVDLHPAFGNQPSPVVEPAQYIDGEVPPEYLHKVSLQLFIERGYEDDTSPPEQVAVMSEWERPTANLQAEQVYIGMAPQQLDASPESTFIVPVLNGRPAPGSQAVARTGLTAPSADTATMAGRLFATVSERGNAAASALSALGSNEPASVQKLLSVVLKVKISSPDGTRTIQRRVADLRGTAQDAFPVSGMFQMVIDVHVGPENPELLYHEMLDFQQPFVQAVPPMMALARNAVSVQEMEASRTYRNLGTPRWLDFELASAALIAPRSGQTMTYRTGPMLASRRTQSTPDGRMRTMTDILSNPTMSLVRAEGETIRIDRSGAVVQGVRETLLESELAGVENGWSERRPARLIESAGELSDEPFSTWPSQALETATSDLEAGYLLAVVDNASSHWWRVDPVTGETLGMGAHGGSEFAEYLIATGGIAISVALFARSVETCDEQYADNQAMADCCIVGNLIATYGTAIGAGAGAAATTTGNALYAASGSISSALGWNAADIGTGITIGQLGIVDGICEWKESN